MHILTWGARKLDTVFKGKRVTSEQGSQKGGKKSQSSKAEGGAVKGHLKNKSEHHCLFYCPRSLPLQHLLWAYGRQLAQPQAG